MRFIIIAACLALFVATASSQSARFTIEENFKVCKGKKFDDCLPCCQEHGYKEDYGNIYPPSGKGFQCICATDTAAPSERVRTTGRYEREEIYGKDYFRNY